jgi:RimJ/RimL family protein N-acetyltransferase
MMVANDENYLFTSQRLGFRNWLNSDIEKMDEINSDEKVMEFFPNLISHDQTIEFILRMQKQFSEKGYCYFAVDLLETNEFIGCIGLSYQQFESEFTPCIDIGWRIKSNQWNKGFATEGAKRCLDFAFNDLKLEKVNAIAPKINLKSEIIMKKIGMSKILEFDHLLLLEHERLLKCNVYEIKKLKLN